MYIENKRHVSMKNEKIRLHDISFILIFKNLCNTMHYI